jgi:branched-chain amino acid transport system substrate-binding protein
MMGARFSFEKRQNPIRNAYRREENMRSPRWQLVGLIAIVLALGATSCGGQATVAPTSAVGPSTQAPATIETSEPFVIGLAGPLTGENAVYGEYMTRSATLAVDQINAAGGIDGIPLRLELGDDQMDPAQSPLIAQRFANDPSILAVIGHFASTNTLAALPIYDQAGVPFLSPSSTSQTLSGMSPWFFRMPSTNDETADSVARYAIEVLGATRIASVYAVSESCITLQDAFEARVHELGGEYFERIAVQVGDQDFAAQVTSLMSLEPDFVFLNTFFAEGAAFIIQAHEAGLRTTYVGNDAVGGQALVDLAGAEAAEGAMYAVAWDPADPSPASQAFVTAFQAAYGVAPESYGAHSYAAVEAIAAALRSGARTRDEIREFLDTTGRSTGFDLVIGHLVWDENHDPHRPMLFLVCRDGAYVSAPEQLPPAE